MGVVAESGPLVRIPERLDRRARLGPFPSAREAARFLCYAAAGALLAPWVSPLLWLPVVAVGFVVSVWQPDGRPGDERAFGYLAWRFRTRRGGAALSGRATGRTAVVRLDSGALAAVVRAGGCPIAYLPPGELERRFGQFREILRSMPPQFAFLGTVVPLRATPVLPPRSDVVGPDDEARRGYTELTELLCRRRRLRRVYVAFRATHAGADAVARLESQARGFSDRIGELGIAATVLTGRDLAEAAIRFDWSRGARPS